MVLVIWTTEGDWTSEWESSWLCYLLGEAVEHKHVPDLSFVPEEFSVVIANTKTSAKLTALTAYLQRFSVNYGLIHLSDESYLPDYSFYAHEKCAWVWRNYWHPIFDTMKKVKCFALGYKKGFALEEYPVLERKNVWCFSGDIKYRHPERIQALNCFNRELPGGVCIIEEGNSFTNRVTGLDTEGYRNMFLSSQFALCPPGNINLDNFRICEALEVGCIPVVTRKTMQQNYTPCYWVRLFYTMEYRLPFIIGEDWMDCVRKVKEVIRDGGVEEMRRECLEFWRGYKEGLKRGMGV